MKRIAALGLSLALLSACGDGAEETPASQTTACSGGGVWASDAWIRPSRAGQPTSAAYLTLCNGEETDDTLTSVAFDGAGAVELHVTKMSDDNMASMTPSQGIPLIAGENAVLAPGGAHIMLIGVNEALTPGDRRTLTLSFENAPDLVVEFEVREQDHEGGAHH